MGFSTELKTVMKLDDKEWKTALESIRQVEKQTTKDIEKNTKKLFLLKDKLAQKDKQLHLAKLFQNKEKEKQYREESKLIKSEIALTNKLNNAQKTGLEFIKIRQKNTDAIDKNTKAKDKNGKSTENLANQTIRYLRWAGTIAGVVYAINRAWRVTLGTGIEVNKMMEDNTSGIGALLSANTQMVLSNGEVVNSYEKFQMGQIVATQTMDDLRKASIKTYATFPQLTEIFQQAIGQTLSMGDAFGSTVEEINTNTIKLAQRMSNIGGAIGQPMDRIREEIRSLLSANASTDSLIATMIFGSPTEANKSIRDAKARGKDGLVDMLDAVFKPFDSLENIESYTRSLLTLEDAWSQLWQTVSKPLFETLTTTFMDLAKDINSAKEALVEFNAHVNTINDIKADAGIGIWEIQLKQVRQELKDLEDDSWAWLKNDKIRSQEIANRKWQILKLEKQINEERNRKTPDLQTKPAFDTKFLADVEKKIQKEKAETLKLTNNIATAEKQILLHKKAIKTNQEAYAKDAATQKILDTRALASQQAIATLGKGIRLDEQKIIEIREKASDKERTANTRRFNEIAKQQKAEFKAITDYDKFIDKQYKKVEDAQNQGFDNWKKIQKEKQQEAERALQQSFEFRRLQAELIRDERSRAIELAKINLDSRKAELLALKEKDGWSDEYYEKVLAAEEELTRRVLEGYTEYGQLMATVGNTMESSFGDFFDFTSDGFMDMQDLALDVLDSIYKALLKNYIIGQASTTGGSGIVGAITSGIGAYFGGVGSVTPNTESFAPQTFSGSFADGGQVQKFADGGLLTGGSGKRDDLYLGSASGSHVFAMGGEYILNQNATSSIGVSNLEKMNNTGQMPSQAPQKITVNIVNESGQEVQATQSDASFNGAEMILSVIIEGVQNNTMGIRDVMTGGR